MAGLGAFTILALTEGLIIRVLSSKQMIHDDYDYYLTHPWAVAVGLLVVNYGVLFLYSSVIYPEFLSPLRKIAKPKASVQPFR